MKKLMLTITLLLFTFVSFNVVFGDTLSQVSQFNNITIFIRFNDEQTYEAPYDLTHYDDMLNATDQPSLKNYYLEASYNMLTIDSFIPTENGEIIYYTDTYDREYFEPYSSSNPNGVTEAGHAEREHGLIQRALAFVDNNDLVPDELDLDVNNDGQIDSLTFMISGEDSGWSSLLWPHKWELYTFVDYYGNFEAGAPTINGVNAYIYTWELLGNSVFYDYQVDVGVLSHETFHLLGAPDLYHYYDYFNVSPVGDWGLMDSTTRIPSHMLGYMKERYAGWIPEVAEITESGTYTLYPLQDSPENIYKIYTGIANQWIYIEYRDDDGFYESTLPGTGLIVYRVNTSLEGNEMGSYDSSGNPTDEVFVFRPGMADLTEPIILLNEGDVDGYIDQAHLTDIGNAYSEMGIGTAIPIFASDGTILDIGIYNVDEQEGFITFDVVIMPKIELVSDDFELRGEEVYLYDSIYMDYEVEIQGMAEGYTAYYTTDGSAPTNQDALYVAGNNISIDANNNNVRVALYDGDTFVSEFDREFDFTKTIESDHNPYGNNKNYIFYFDTGNVQDFTLEFDNRSELEEDYDYLTIAQNGFVNSYTNLDLAGYTESFSTDELVIRFETDVYVDEYFGFLVDVIIGDNVQLNMLGNTKYTIDVFDEFVDPGYELNGFNLENYTVDVVSDLNTAVLGTYTITYTLKDSSNQVLDEYTRTVEVVDIESPTLSLNGEDYIELEVGTDFIDPYITFGDNYDTNLTIDVSASVDTSTLGTTTITYTVTDSSGNTVSVDRVVVIQDTTAPFLELIGDAEINLEVNDDFVDPFVNYSDNFDVDLTVEVNEVIDTSVLGTTIITYKVVDSSGNESIVIRTVNVADTTAPTGYILPGLDTIYSGDNWEDSSFEASDNFTTELSVEVTGEVNENTPGTYEITYTIIDSSGNELILRRMVTVVEELISKPIVNCREMVTTLSTDDTLVPNTCISNLGVMELENENYDMTVGAHELVYYVEVDGVRYEHSLYYYVYEVGTTINEVAFIERREE